MQLYDGRDKIIRLFENKDITRSMFAYDAKSEPKEHDGVKESEQQSVESIGERTRLRRQKSDGFNNIITEKDNIINKDLFKKYFHQFESLSDMQKKLSKTKNAQENSELVQVIQNEFSNFEKEIGNISKEEEPYEILDTVSRILEFNRQDQQGQRLKLLTPQQMLNRLPISFAQLEAVNNSEKLKNEIRQLLYSLYRSKHYPKQSINT